MERPITRTFARGAPSVKHCDTDPSEGVIATFFLALWNILLSLHLLLLFIIIVAFPFLSSTLATTERTQYSHTHTHTNH